MKKIILTLEEDGSIYLQVTGPINFQEIIRTSAALMAKSVNIGLHEKIIREDEIEDFYRRTIGAARLMVKMQNDEKQRPGEKRRDRAWQKQRKN